MIFDYIIYVIDDGETYLSYNHIQHSHYTQCLIDVIEILKLIVSEKEKKQIFLMFT